MLTNEKPFPIGNGFFGMGIAKISCGQVHIQLTQDY